MPENSCYRGLCLDQVKWEIIWTPVLSVEQLAVLSNTQSEEAVILPDLLEMKTFCLDFSVGT